jgi:hypothetical protein
VIHELKNAFLYSSSGVRAAKINLITELSQKEAYAALRNS